MGTNPSYFGKSSEGSGDLPVEQVSWHDAVEFCQRLSQLPAEQAAGRVYRLPSEAEWEFACRAGGQRAFCFGNQATWLTNYAWFVANADDQTHPVGKKQPNAFGLFDMHGNVHEWCADVYGGYSPAAAAYNKNNGNSGRVYRGGSWCSSPARCRAAWRGQQDPDHRSPFNGFRIAMNPPARLP
jgi:formylglycine-generating enzyme required for sulfatase activity